MGRVRRAAIVAIAATTLPACGGSDTGPSSPGRTAPGPSAERARPVLCDATTARSLGRVDDPTVDELSGLARSGRDHDSLLAVEDSGNAAGVTLLRRDGRVTGFARVTGAQNVDWEDLATGTRADGAPEVYVADIGDNEKRRSDVQIYVVAEPRPGAAATAPARRLNLRYPDGAHDAETLLFDPIRREVIIVTKDLIGARSYRAGTGDAPGSSAELRRGPAVPLGVVTAGDVSADGRTVALRSYGTLAVWRRRGSEPLTQTLARSPCRAPASLAPEGQGEALALAADGRSAITAPEGSRPLLRRYR